MNNTLAGPPGLPGGYQPGHQLQGALGVGHLAPASYKGIDSLSRQSEQAPQVDLVAILPEARSQLAPQLVPERGLVAGPQGAATPGWAAAQFETKGLACLMGHGGGGRDEQIGQGNRQIQFRVIAALEHVIY